MKAKQKVSVAQYIDQMISMSQKSQKEIATEVGYDKPNVMTMIKQGRTKLPLNKVGPVAKALEVDPVHLLRITMNEYMPETWEAIQSLIGEKLITDSESRLIHVIRKAAGSHELELNDQREAELSKLISSWASQDEKRMVEPGRDLRRAKHH